MDTIGQTEIWSFKNGSADATPMTNTEIRKGKGHRVNSYMELAEKVAELQFRNREHVLMFRGQDSDRKNVQNNSTVKPSIFRPEPPSAKNPGQATLQRRYDNLEYAEQRLVNEYKAEDLMGKERVERHRIVRWAILQHYEVCPTPLLDVTHSLRIAASFASLAQKAVVYLMVLGVPNLSGAITASAESGLEIIRLSSVCPPSAVRPHIQEGYLLGEYPELPDYDQKSLYKHYEVDFGRRLVAKFYFKPKTFWARSEFFPEVEKDALYPTHASDKLHRICTTIHSELAAQQLRA